jgi:hypothetical protein
MRNMILLSLTLAVLLVLVKGRLDVLTKLENCPAPDLVGNISLNSEAVRAARISCSFQSKCLARLVIVDNVYEKECR